MAFNIFATATSDIPLANLDANFTLIGAAAAASTLYPTATTSITYGTAGTTHNFSGSGLAVTGTLSATGAITNTLAGGIFLINSSGGTSSTQARINNTGGDLRLGIESSTGNGIQIGTAAYAAVFGNQGNYPAQITSNGALVASFSSTGLSVTGGITGDNGLVVTAGQITLGSGGSGAVNTQFIMNGSSGNTRGPIVRMQRNSVTKWEFGLQSAIVGDNSDNFNIYSNSTLLLSGTQAGAVTIPGTLAAGATTVTGTLSATGVVTFSNYGVGTATFNGSGVISSVSDETWKVKDGAPVDTDAMLNKLEPGYWYYNDEKKETFGKDRQLGFYAQNVNAAIGPEAAPEPETVVTKNDDGTETSVTKPWGYYDRSVLAVTVMSLQKALATIESLTARITTLEAK